MHSHIHTPLPYVTGDKAGSGRISLPVLDRAAILGDKERAWGDGQQARQIWDVPSVGGGKCSGPEGGERYGGLELSTERLGSLTEKMEERREEEGRRGERRGGRGEEGSGRRERRGGHIRGADKMGGEERRRLG